MSKLDEFIIARTKYRALVKQHADLLTPGLKCPPLGIDDREEKEWGIAAEAFEMAFEAAPQKFWLLALVVYRAHVEKLRDEADAEFKAEMAEDPVVLKGDEG